MSERRLRELYEQDKFKNFDLGAYLLNSLVVYSYSLDHDRLILFHNTSTISLLDHPTGTMCNPDFVACPATRERIHWTEIDATVILHSDGEDAIPSRGLLHTLPTASARLDCVSVRDFCADVKGVELIIGSADSRNALKLNLKDAE